MSSALFAFGPALLARHGLLSNLPFHRFYHGYESYMAYAFPHDDLKPLSFSYTDSLGKLTERMHSLMLADLFGNYYWWTRPFQTAFLVVHSDLA